MKNRIFIIISLFVGVIVFILFSSILLLDKLTISNLSQEQLDSQRTEKVSFFNNYIKHKKRHLSSLRNNPTIQDFIVNNHHKEIVKNIFLALAQSHDEIFQVRYIDITGNEIIRIENNKQGSHIVADAKLQNKKGRYYFEETLKKNGETYYSNIDLNMERGRIEKPIVPTLRIAQAVIINNIKYGVIILNINLHHFLEEIQNSSLHYVNLIYDDGEIIINKDRRYNWSRDFRHNKKIHDIYEDFPSNYNQMATFKNEHYFISQLQIDTPNKIFMLLVPKEFNKYEQLQEEVEQRIYLLIFLTSLGIPLGYFVSGYINRLYKRKLVYEKTKTDNVLINAVINATNDLIFYKDKDFNYIGCNHAFEKFVGRKKEIIIGRTDYEIFDKEHANLFRQMDEKMLEKDSMRVNTEWVTYASGRRVYLQTKKIPFHYDNNGSVGIMGISRDITELHTAQQKIKEQNYIDDLTKCLNRRSFNEHMDKRIDLFKRYNDSFCIAMFDLDDFKQINDTYGHHLGDNTLIEVAKIVKSTLRRTDLLFRVGGEEFIILFPKEEIELAQVVAQKVLNCVQTIDIFEDKKITVSIGLTQVNKEDSVDTLYTRVDNLMYTSKKEGKNRITIG